MTKYWSSNAFFSSSVRTNRVLYSDRRPLPFKSNLIIERVNIELVNRFFRNAFVQIYLLYKFIIHSFCIEVYEYL